MGDHDTNANACDLTSSDNVRVSGERGDCRSALKSPVMIIFLCVARNGDRVSKNCVGDATIGRLYTTAMRRMWLLCLSSVIMYSVVLSNLGLDATSEVICQRDRI